MKGTIDSNLVSLQNGPAGEDPRDAIPALNDLLREGAADIVVYTLVSSLTLLSLINRIFGGLASGQSHFLLRTLQEWR